jgi:hypothetical protein
MALLDMFKRGAKSAGKNLESYIGGLLGEDISQLSEQERKQLRRQGMSAIFDAMARGTTPTQGLAGVAQLAGARLEQKRLQGRQKAAEEEMQRISAMTFGGAGPTGQKLETLVEGEEPYQMMRYFRQDPKEALRRMYGTSAGRHVAQMAPGLLELAQEGTTGRTVGGAVYNPLTGQFSRPEEARPAAQARASGGGSAGEPKFSVVRGADAEALGFPKGTVLQRNSATGEVKVLSAVPASERTSLAGKERTLNRVEVIASRIEKQLDKVSTGGFLGVVGSLSRVFDSQDAKLFESYRQQLSGAIRAALRIPGEGALSDFEQRQYGLQLPELGLSKDNNLQILESLKEQVRAAGGGDVSGGPPPGISQAEWDAMTPAERSLFQ